MFGMVSGPSGKAIEGASVELRSKDNRRGGRRGTSRSSGTGEYQVGGLLAGNYQVRVSAPRHASMVIPEITLGEDEARRLDLRLGPERRLVGIVIDEQRVAIDRARVSVSEKQASRRSGTSDPTGAFSIDRLGPGELTVTVEAEGFLRYRESNLFASDGSLEIVLRQAYSITGLILDQGTGDPIHRARVQLGSGDGSRSARRTRNSWARTDAEGIFLIEGLDVGEYQLTITADGYVPFTWTDVRLPARPSEEEIVVALRAGGRVRGTVYDPVGRGLSGARVRAFRLPDDPNAEAATRRRRSEVQGRTTEDGAFSLSGLLEGRFELVFSHEDHLERVEEVTISLDQPEPLVTVTLERGAKIEGRVYGPGGSLQESGTVVLAGRLSRRARVRKGGAYRFTGLPAGTYTVRFQAGRTSSAPEGLIEILLPAAGSRTIDLQAP